MTAIADLRRIAQGQRPEDDGLLGSARYRSGSLDLIGEEDILSEFRRQPIDFGDTDVSLASDRSAVLLSDRGALFADLYDGRVGRIWRIGQAAGSATPTPSISVAFDVDLHQSRREWIAFRAEDHPDLASHIQDILLEASMTLLSELSKEALRVRGFVVRAFSDGDAAAALLSVYILSRGERRSPQSRYAVVSVPNGGATASALDPLRESDWTPRF
ncbi:MAG: hypothetical protein WBF53_05305 [Litorimonas sp.]